MISPPTLTAFYSLRLEKDLAAAFIAGLAPTAGRDIEVVALKSANMSSDMQATNELGTAIEALRLQTSVPEPVLTFNPMYLPMDSEELSKSFELDHQGDIQAVAGFANPFISAQYKLKVDDTTLIDGKISFPQFELPSVGELLAGKVSIS